MSCGRSSQIKPRGNCSLAFLTIAYNILIKWGEYYLKGAHWDLAQSNFREALKIAPDMRELVGIASYGLARVALAQGNVTEARPKGQESFGFKFVVSQN
jgi:hypothetical protein